MDFIVVMGLAIFGTLVLLWYWKSKVKTDNWSANMDAVAKASNNLYVIENDLLYEGHNSREVSRTSFSWSKMQDWGSVTVLYITNNGNWFTLALTVADGSITENKFTAVTERFVRDWLASDPPKYKEHFGQPEKA